MNHRERFVRVLTGQEVDRVPFMRVFGGSNHIVPAWEDEHPGIGKNIDELLGFEGVYRGWQTTRVNMALSQLPPRIILEDSVNKRVVKEGDGTVRIIQKGQDFGSHIVDWPVKTRSDWMFIKEHYMQADDRTRFPLDWQARVQEYNTRDYPLQLTHRGVYGFIRNLLGDLNLAYAFYDDPELVHDIMDTYTDMAIAIWQQMVPVCQFDLIECWEDMACRNGSLISPEFFNTFMKPNYQKIAQFAHEHNIPIILVDSDGNIEELTGLMLAAGVTSLYPYEVQAGNDVTRVLDTYPTLGVIGGLDKSCMTRGKEAMDREVAKARMLIQKGRFIPGPDHFVLSDTSFADFRYFMEQLREVVMTTKPGSAPDI